MANATAARPRSAARPPVIEPASPAQLIAVKQEIKTKVLVEREREVDVGMIAALAASNMHLGGPPGTAKSLGARALCERIGVTRANLGHFEKTIHPQMPADAIIGGYDMEQLLKSSRLVRKVEGYLPGARTALLDEISRANGPLSDALLPMMNTEERLYEADGRMERAPLLFLVTTSNFELDPNDPYLGAFADRFVFKCKVGYIKSSDAFKDMVRRNQARRRGEPSAQATEFVELDAFMAAQEAVRMVDVTEDDFLAAFVELKARAYNQGLVVSDRRWEQILHGVAAQAYMSGRDSAAREDLAICEHGIWRIDAEIPKAREVVKPFLSTFERDAADKREEAREGIEAHEKLAPVVEGTPIGTRIEQDVQAQLTDHGRTLRVVWQRVRESIEQAEKQGSECPSLRELFADLENVRQWRENNDLSANW